MTILFRLIMLSMFSFAYSDCVDIDNQTDCEASAGCEWHVEDDGTAGCEDVDDHDHDHEHCDDVTTEIECENLDGCTWHIHDGVGECESASADCGETDHFNTDGLELEYDGAEIYSQFQGLIEGSVEIEVNGTKDLSIHFLDGNGDEVVIDESTIHCYPLSFSIADPSIISIEMEDHDDHDDHDHDDEEHCEVFSTESDCEAESHCHWHVENGVGECEDAEDDDHDHEDEDHGGHLTFELTGLAVGSTTFTVSIMHQGHADYTSMPILVTVTEEVCPVPGDVNGSGTVNVADAVFLVYYILGSGTNATCGDMNDDGSIDINDIIAIINIILSDRSYSSIDAVSSQLMISEDSLRLESDGFVQGIQLTLSHGYNFEIELAEALISEYKTTDNQTTLIIATDGSHSITDIATFKGDIVVESVHVVNQSGDVAVEQVIELSSIKVSVVGPNPFNPSTQLSIAMPEAGFLSVNVYNLLGQKVATLVDNYMEANTSGHIVNFNASHLASGVYIVQAVTAGNIATQKIMLMK